MANFLNASLTDVQQMVVMPTEEAAAVGANFSQQQPPPQQHVAHKTAFQQQQYVLVTNPDTVETEPNISVSKAPSTVQSQSIQQEFQPQLLQFQVQQMMPAKFIIQTIPPSQQVALQNKQTNQVQMQSVAVQKMTSNQSVVSSPQVVSALQAVSQTVIHRPSLQTPPRLIQHSQASQGKAQTPPLSHTTPSPQRPMVSVRAAQGSITQQSQPPVLKTPRPPLLRKQKSSPKTSPDIHLKQSDQTVLNQQTISPLAALQSVQAVQSTSDISPVQQVQQDANQIQHGQVPQSQGIQIQTVHPANQQNSSILQNGNLSPETKIVEASSIERDDSPRTIATGVMKTQITSKKEEPQIIVTSPQTVSRSKVGQRLNQTSPIMKGNVQYIFKHTVANPNQAPVVHQNVSQVQLPQQPIRILRLNALQLQQLQQGVIQIPVSQSLSGQSPQTVQYQVPQNLQMQIHPQILHVQQPPQQIQLLQPEKQQEEEAQSLHNQLPTQSQSVQVQLQEQQVALQPQLVQIQSYQPQQQQSQLALQQQQNRVQTQQQQIQIQSHSQLQLAQQQQILMQQQQKQQQQQQQQQQLQQQHQQQQQKQQQQHQQAESQNQQQQVQSHSQQVQAFQPSLTQIQLQAQQQLVQLRTQNAAAAHQQPAQAIVQAKQGVQQQYTLINQPLSQSSVTQTTVNGMSTAINSPHNVAKVRPVGGMSRQQNSSPLIKPKFYSGPRQKKPDTNTNILLTNRTTPGSQPMPISQSGLHSLLKQFADGKGTRIVTCTEGGIQRIAFQEVPQTAQIQKPTSDTSTVQEEEQITVYDGVNVEDTLLTEIPQEYVVSETGELVLADNTNVKPEPKLDSSNVSNTTIIDTSVNSISEDSSEIISSSASGAKKLESEFKIIPGMSALCGFCGYLSRKINRCERCNRTLPDTTKIVADANVNVNINVNTVQPAPLLSLAPIATNVLLRRPLNISEKILGKLPPRSLQPLQNLPNLDVKRKRCSTPRRPRVKVPEEPEILTLSSDDEDKLEVKPEKKPDRESQILANGSFSSISAESRIEEAAAMDEADSAEETRQNSVGVQGGGLFEQAVEGSMSSPFILIVCRTIRIGTFRVKPSQRVVISSQGLEIKMPLPTGPEVTVNVGMNHIERVLVSFCRSMPVLFFYLKKEGGSLVRQILNMKDPKPCYYFDPQSSDDTQKRITLLPEKITDDQKMVLKKIFEGNKLLLSEIDNPTANDILVKSSPTDVKLRFNLPGNEIQTIMVYPPPPAKGGISINTEDYGCLGEDQFLNDVIIDFYLKYLMQSVLSDEDRERTHVFSTFFYKRLTCKPKKGRRHPVEDDPNLTPAQKRHARVKGWTKNVNLFSKDFIIIPINENCHWFLAIICYPGQDGCLRMSDNTPIDVPKPQTSTVAAAVAAAAAAATTHSKLKVKDNVMSIGSTTITPVKSTPAATITLDHNGEEGSDRDEAEGDEEEMNENSDDEESAHASEESNGSKDTGVNAEGGSVSPPISVPVANSNLLPKKGKSFVREGIKQPCILIFDSLVGAPRYRVAATLREYLSIEYKVKEKKDKEFSKDTIKGMLPKVPQQTNFTDCGLYLLQYAEMFFKDPIRDYHAPIKQLVNWFPEEVVSRKREDIVNLLKDLMMEQNIDPNSVNLPQLTFNYPSNNLKAQQQAEDEEAQARLAAADSEADATGCQTSQETSMEENVSCENEVTVPHSTTEEVSLTKSENVVSGAINNTKSTEQPSSLKQKKSLVDYPDSSNDSSTDSSLVKRSQSEIDTEDLIEKKKRKAE